MVPRSTPLVCLVALGLAAATLGDGPPADKLAQRVAALVAPLGPGVTVSVAFRDLETGGNLGSKPTGRPTRPAR